MLNYLRYILYSALYPKQREFIDAGLGIEARYTRCRKFWDVHLERSKAFQRRIFAQAEMRGSLLICGAGRGYDLDQSDLQKNFSSIVLVDADPLARARYLRAHQKHIETRYEVKELTGALGSWKETIGRLIAVKADPNELKFALEALTADGVELSSYAPSLIVSLNLLSQISLAWREWVIQILGKKLKIFPDAVERLPAPLEEALIASCATLQRAHLQSLNRAGARTLVLIYDTTFLYHDREREVLREPALFVNVEQTLSEYSPMLCEEWSWQVAPQGIEQQDYGVTHLVRAQAFRRREDLGLRIPKVPPAP